MQFLLSKYTALKVMVLSAIVALSVSVPAMAQSSDLGTVAETAATGAIGKAALVAGVIIGFAVLYKLIRRVTG